MHLQDYVSNLDFMDMAQLAAKMMMQREVMENPEMKFTCNDKVELKLENGCTPKQLVLHLALALSAFKVTGEYEAQIQEFELKPKVDQIFDNFSSFILNEFAKQNEQNKSMAQLVRFGIANTVHAKEANIS